jgi:pimeloyl-ACP methyl ester carboxylesterase/DNA-binding CsgD family transcriptional regulator
VEQQIRFCAAADGVRIAYATHGRGPPLIKAANWLTHLEFDWRSPIWRHWLEGLARGRTVVRYDQRGCGLSDREVDRLSLDAWVEDLEAVVDATGLERFPLLGLSQGGAIAIAYAVRHPDRVSHLVLMGCYAQGWRLRATTPEQRERNELLMSAMRVGWAGADATFRRLFTHRFMPDATPEQMEWWDELQRASTSAENAARMRSTWGDIDITDLLERVTTPTLVLHARDEVSVPFDQGRLLATRIPGARFVPLQSSNHILLADEPAWEIFLAELHDFIGTEEPPVSVDLADLSKRELQLLELVAAGLSNEEIAERLYLSVRTVERHLSNIYVKLRISGKAARAAAAARYSESR